MFKKNLVFIIILFLLCGCSADYNLRIDDNKITEQLIINDVDISRFDSVYVPINIEADDPKAFEEKLADVDYYKMIKKNNTVTLKYDYNIEDFSSAYLFNSCFDSVDSYVEDNRYIISTTGDFSCFELYDDLDNVNVNIYSQYRLINSNATRVNGFNYIWNINKNNISDGIYLELDINDRDNTFLESIQKSNLFSCLIFIGVVLVFLVLFYAFKFYSRLKDKV